MKLKNKKTGEVFDALIREKGGAGSYSLIVCDIKSYEYSKGTFNETHFILSEYETLAELNEEWEDYKPNKPLIKDEKIRKAVRVWAEVNDVANVFVTVIKDAEEGCLYWELATSIDWEQSITIRFGGELPNTLKDERRYTIAELCGEEEDA